MTLVYLPETDREDFNDLVWAATRGNIEKTIEITSAKPELAAHRDAQTGIAPIIYSIIHGHTDCTHRMLPLIGHPDLLLDMEGNSPFMWAVSMGDIPTARILLALGSDIHKTNKYGRDAMMEAARRNRGEMIDFLAGMGADVNTQDNKGRTPLMIAAKRFSEVAIKHLYVLKADATITDADGETVHDKAHSRGYTITKNGSTVYNMLGPVRPENETRETAPAPG